MYQRQTCKSMNQKDSELLSNAKKNLTSFFELCTSNDSTFKQISTIKELLLENIKDIQNLSPPKGSQIISPPKQQFISPTSPPQFISPKDLVDFKIEFRRMIDSFIIVELETLEKITSNIVNNPDDQKFRKIASKKITRNIWDVLFLLGFKEKVVDFVPKLVFSFPIKSKHGQLIQEALCMIKDTTIVHHKRKQENLDERAKFKKEQEYKQTVVEKVRLDMIERTTPKVKN